MNNRYGWQLYHWHIEISAKCTLKCPRCPRTELPATSWTNDEFTLEEFSQAFTPQFIKENVKRFTFCGDIGDPIYCKDFLLICKYIKNILPTCHIFIITNGSYKKKTWWEELATILNEYDTVNFSVDGYNQESNNMYRVNSNWESIMLGMEVMGHLSKAHVVWAAIYFKFNQSYQNKIKDIATFNGCDSVQWTKSTKFASKYDTYGPYDHLEPDEQYISKTNRYERSVVQITDRVQPIDDYMQTNITKYNETKPQGNILPLCLVGNRGMYLSADGTLHPCSWTSFPYIAMSDGEKTINYKDSFFAMYREQLSVKSSSIEDVLNHDLWEKLFSSWKNSPWVECSLKCKKDYVDYDYAVGYETN